jgi:hypothetical protein
LSGHCYFLTNPLSRTAICLLALIAISARGANVETDPSPSPRVKYGAERLESALALAHVTAHVVVTKTPSLPHEHFKISPVQNDALTISGGDDSGALYGCLELASDIAAGKGLPSAEISDGPVFTLRGPCIGMQKPYLLPGRHVYEYPYTPQLFPFFYDKEFWRTYLDFLAKNRFNTLYLWSGHPFASLVKLKDYPYAMEVSEEDYARNVEMYRYIAAEADKRGIWVVQMFYNILVSKPFAEHNHIETQLKSPTELTADYTRKSIAEFVKQYPNVGLMLCLGEALQGIDNQVAWATQVVLPGVKDGMKEAGLRDEPPVIIRTHATDATIVMPEALKVYRNLYTEAKFNGESLTTWEPRGKWQELHHAMSRMGSTHVMNVHILANLEPFRYGDQKFIQKCMLAGRDRLGAKGLHLYPLCYWNWPDSADSAEPPLKQIERDWIWFEAWGRYAWNPDVDEKTDHAYWVRRIGEKYGDAAAENILAAYNDSGECAPRLIRRFGITEGNRQTLSLGMTLDELVKPKKYSENPDLWESDAPPGERLNVYDEREWNHQAHEGETPVSVIKEVLDYSAKAVAEIDAAAPVVTKNTDEFKRVQNDMHCIEAMSQNYAAKVKAAICVLRYAHSHDIADIEQAESHLAESLDHFRELTRLTTSTYRFANSMQTRQRKIPVPGGADGKPANYHWSQLLPIYEKELADFHARVEQLKQPAN